MDQKKKSKSSPYFDVEFGPDFFVFFQIIKLSQVQELDILGFEENGQRSSQLNSAQLSSQLRSDQIWFQDLSRC
jgi:hypothetical protein